jgi:hypothetical protein
MSACVLAPSLRAEDCAVTESRASLAELSGARISSIDVASEGPHLPGIARAAAGLHRPSTDGTIRRQLLFAAGDTVDTLLVGETLRRLRQQRLFSDAVVIAKRCTASGAVELTVRTRDTWTLRPTARYRTPSLLSLGVEERNLLGTGRLVSFTNEFSSRGNGTSLSLADPFVFGRDVAASGRIANLAGTHTLRLGVRKHEYSVLDGWRAEANLARLSYGDTAVTDRALHTIAAMALVGRRVGPSSRPGLAGGGATVTLLLAGVEFDSAASILTTSRARARGSAHVRSFVGADIGLQRRAARFDTASWVVPGRGFLDVPTGWEGEVLVGSGYERDARTLALKHDLWFGRVWLPHRGSIVMTDGWASGYLGHGVDRNEIMRAALSWYELARGGLWGLRLTAEEMTEIDPDRRALSLMPLADYTAPAVRPFAVRAGRSVSASIERAVHLHQVAANSVLDVGGFLASSYRWRVDDIPGNVLHAEVIGARLRLLSANGSIASMRLDVGYPVGLSGSLPRKSFLVLTFGTLFDASRQRDGRRVY